MRSLLVSSRSSTTDALPWLPPNRQKQYSALPKNHKYQRRLPTYGFIPLADRDHQSWCTRHRTLAVELGYHPIL
jgi:hypothetical protein